MRTEPGKTFSESWHRVAELRVSLRSSVNVRKQLFQGKIWHVLRDPFNNHFFRLEKQAYDFVSRLRRDQTINEIWQDCHNKSPEEAPGQEDVIRLLAQLYHANLLYCELPVDGLKLFERYKKRRQRENRGKLLNLMFFRIPLIDPDAWLDRHSALVHFLTSRSIFAAGLFLLLLATKSVIERWPLLLSETKNLLDLNNLFLLYAGLVLVKVLHEVGHTLVCKRYGGEVHTVGVMFMIFTPLPFMDATSSWAFRERRQRILVASSGMIYEFAAAAGAALIWAYTGPGTVHSLALNMLITASVSTLIFNANPLLRYDGYYILSDLIDIPNLQPRSIEQLKYLLKRYFLKVTLSNSPANTPKEARWLCVYGVCSGAYRLLVYGGIILYISDKFLLLGVFLAAILLVLWVLVPIARITAYLTTSEELNRIRPAVTLKIISVFILVVTTLGIIPIPSYFRAPGVLEAQNHLRVAGQTDGQLIEIFQPSGNRVQSGEPLFRLINPELTIEIKRVRAQRDELTYLQQQSAAFNSDSTRITLQRRLVSVEAKITDLLQRQASLLVTATKNGLWIAPDLDQRIGYWLNRGEKHGDIIETDQFKFVAVVNQENAANLFNGKDIKQIRVRLNGYENYELNANAFGVIPFEQGVLPSATLGVRGGGAIQVKNNDNLGLETIEPYFQISAVIQNPQGQRLYDGHSGVIRFSLPSEPALTQLYRKIKQFVQQRYQT